MPFDVPPADAAPTRRARRVAAARPVPEAPLTRRERRIREIQNTTPSAVPPLAEAVLTEAFLAAPAAAPAVIDAVVAPVAEAPAVAEPVIAERVQVAEPVEAEPVKVDEPAAAQPEAEPEPEAEPIDLFAEAARALNFTGETPVVADESAEADEPAAAHVAPRRVRPSAMRRVATVAASVSAFGVVGLLAVGMTTPLSALAATDDGEPVVSAKQASAIEKVHEEIQAFVAPADAAGTGVAGSTGYDTTTFAEIAAVSGINTANAVYVNDPTADIQWPIILGTSKSYGFGSRWGRLHEGIDFTPGAGAPVQAIAEGTVRIGAYGAYGNNVYIDHVIDGVKITSHYAHMQDGSITVVNGQHVEVGDVIGKVGNTGRSFGAHLHFELRDASGRSFDPMPWLQEHAGTHYPKDSDAQAASTE